MTTLFDGLSGIFVEAFGQAVTIIPQRGASRNITAIFRRSSEDSLVDPGLVSSEAYLSCQKVDVVRLAYDDLIKVNGETFAVGSIMPEDKGMVRINLRDNS